jgi:hypothetical protein
VSPPTHVSLLRLVRARRTWLGIGFWVAIAIGPAFLARRNAVGHGADHALLGLYAAIALPFLAYSVLSGVLGSDGLRRSVLALANFGASPVQVAFSTVTVAVIASGILGGALGSAVDAIGHGQLDPPLPLDALHAFSAGALGGAAYAALFALGASFGARGLGRSVLLVLDWVVGNGSDASALFTPRAHIRSLLGGAAPLDASGRASYAALALMVIVFTALACRRAARTTWNPAPGRGVLGASSTRG